MEKREKEKKIEMSFKLVLKTFLPTGADYSPSVSISSRLGLVMKLNLFVSIYISHAWQQTKFLENIIYKLFLQSVFFL